MDVLRDLNVVSIIGRVLLAVLVGGIIGFERMIKNQPVGARTYMVVSMGACLVMMTNQYICQVYGTGDPSRLGAQVISGIGFLGAGTIIVTGNKIRGLTTAAGLWSSACIGLAIGVGFYEGAIAVAATLLFIMTVFKRMEQWYLKDSKAIRLYINLENNGALNNFIAECHERNIRVDDMQISKLEKAGQNGIVAIMTLKLSKKFNHDILMQELKEIEGIWHIEELS